MTTPTLVATEAEISVIGGCLIDPDAILIARRIITPEMLAVARHRLIYRAMIRLADEGQALDPVTVSEHLRARDELDDAGGLPYLAELLDAVPTAANIEHHAQIVAERAARRRLEAVGRQIAADAADPDLSPAETRARISLYADEVANLEGIDTLPAATAIGDLPPPEPVPWGVRNLIPAADISLLASDGGVGKTTLAAAIAAAMAAARPALEHWPFRTTAGPVLIMSEEDSADIIRNRIMAIATGHGWDRDLIARRVHLIAQAGVSLGDPEWQAHIRAEAARIRPVAIFFDPYTELIEGEENSNDAAKAVIRFLRSLAVETGAAVIVIHHLGKAGEGKRKIDRIRGASALHAAARSVLILDAHPQGMRVDVAKFNRGAPPAPFVIERTVYAHPDNPGMWETARLEYVSLEEAAAAERNSTVERLTPAVIEYLTNNPGCTKRQLREGVDGARHIDIIETFEALVHRGVAKYDAPQKRGQAGSCWIVVPSGSGVVPGTGSGTGSGDGAQGPIGSLPTGNRSAHGRPEPVDGREPVEGGMRLIYESPKPHPADAILDDEEVA